MFGLGTEENRIYEALIAKITLSMLAYNIVSYINRIKHEPQTLGELFRDLECELETLAISMQLFIKILTQISEIKNVVKENKNLLDIIAVLSAYTQKEVVLDEKLELLYSHLEAFKTTSVNFTKCEEKSTCLYCDYKTICKR